MKNHFLWFIAVIITIVKEAKCTVIQSTKNVSEVNPVDDENLKGTTTDFRASIRLKIEDNPFGSDHRCGGALVTCNKVITAAQCLVDPTELHLTSYFPPSAFIVVLGSSDLGIKTPETFISDVKNFHVHADFDPIRSLNNIAILFLTSSVPLNHTSVAPVPILKMTIPPGTVCDTSGWGHSTFGAVRSTVAVNAEVTIFDISVCEKNHANVAFDGLICAGQKSIENKNICQADLGGPLICNGSIAGIVSYGLDCAKPESPALFTNVGYFRNWIDLTMSEKSQLISTGSSAPANIAQNISQNTYAPLDPKILGGQPTTFDGNWHIASIRLIPNDIPFGDGHICCGSLFSPQKIVTAAHCLFMKQNIPLPAKYFKVVMGTLNRFKITNNTIIISNGITYAYHADYNPSEDKHDVAVIFLNKAIPANHPVVKPITLNRLNQETGTSCKIAGWGYTNYEQGLASLPKVLYEAEIHILDYNTCKHLFARFWHEGMMCAGDWAGGKDTCVGDSGGGLVCYDTLVGIVSWGVDCGRPGSPGVYMNVAYYFEWIQNCKSGVQIQKQYFHSYSIMFFLILTVFFVSHHRYCI